MAGPTWLLLVGAGVVAVLLAALVLSVLGPFERCDSCPHRHLLHRWQFCLLCACPGWSRPLGPTTLPGATDQP